MNKNEVKVGRVGHYLNVNWSAKIAELVIVFALTLLLIQLAMPLAVDSFVLKQVIIWSANILMLLLIWLGIKLRGQTWSDFGITFGKLTFKDALNTFLLSLFVFLIAVIAFVLGSIIMANITGIPQQADMSNYEYLQNNIPLLLLSLIGVYFISSFTEEVIYRAFLINRMIELGLDTKLGKVIVVVASAVIFGLIHYQWGPMGMVQTGFMGLALGYFYLRLNRKFWILVLAHIYMDTLLLVQMYFSSN